MKRLEEIILPKLEAEPDRRCIWYEGEYQTRRNLLNLVDECERGLKKAGFCRGQRLVSMLRNSPLIPALSLAAWKLGGTFCPLNEKAGIPSLKGTLKLIRPFCVITEHEIPELSTEWPCITMNLDDRIFPADFTGVTQPPETDEYAVIFATSGTTGNPKAVPLTHNNLVSNCDDVREYLHLSSKDRFLTVLPNFHSFGYTVTTILPLTLGAELSIAPSFLPPAATIRALTETHIDVMFVVPAIISFLLMNVEKGKLSPEALSSIRIICTGGDRLNPNVHELSKRLLGRDVMEGYGLTETSPVICVNPDCETQKWGTVGPVLPSYEWKLKTREGQDTSDNEGVLWVKGPCVTPGYLHAPEITAERFDSEGWLNTGDYVRVDEEGYISILDRVTDIIIVGGFNVYPQEVEKILSEHEAVSASVVVGMPHEINGEIPKAYVKLKDGYNVSKQDIIRYAKEKLAHFKVPRSVEFVDEFPLSGTGKILRRVLRERARQ